MGLFDTLRKEEAEKLDCLDEVSAAFGVDVLPPKVANTGLLNAKRFAYIENVSRIHDTKTDQLLNTTDFNSLTANWEKVPVGREDGKFAEIPYSKAWLASPTRPQYLGLTCDPGYTGTELLNTWKGWPYKPIKGDITPFIFVARHVLGEENLVAFMCWVAYAIQNPGKRSLYAMVLLSLVHGVGKGLIAQTVGALHGEGKKDLSPDILTSQFNGWASNCTFAICDEFSIEGKRGLMSKVKALITEPFLLINEKNHPTYTTRSTFSLMFMTNDPAALHIEKSDRRFCVHTCKGQPLPAETYANFMAWREAGGLNHLMAYLLAMDLKNYSPHAHAPSTSDKQDMADLSASDLERWLYDFCESAPREVYTRKELKIEYEIYSGAKCTESAVGRALRRSGMCAECRLWIKGRSPERFRVVAVRNESMWAAATTAAWLAEFQR